MPYPKSAYENFQKEYGKEGKSRFFAWKNANPDKFKKALRTAQKEGGSHVLGHSGVVRKMLRKKKG